MPKCWGPGVNRISRWARLIPHAPTRRWARLPDSGASAVPVAFSVFGMADCGPPVAPADSSSESPLFRPASSRLPVSPRLPVPPIRTSSLGTATPPFVGPPPVAPGPVAAGRLPPVAATSAALSAIVV